jgi:hypothetical protein
MAQRILPALVIGFLASVVLNLLMAVFLLEGRTLPQAFGMGTSSGGGFLMATEHGPDQMPVCFVLRTDRPHLMVYKSDVSGLLQLTSSRKIEGDLRLPDNFLGRTPGKTQPPVQTVSKAVKDLPPEAEAEKESEKESEKGEKKEKK